AAGEGPVCLPPGEFVRGRAVSRRRDERHPHPVRVEAFCLDRTLVTRSEFARFVAATAHVTDAERRGYGLESVEGMLDWEWRRAPHADWRRPFTTEDADLRGFLRDDAPAVMVSWNDAAAFCAWRRGRLPGEDEWEYAMRAGSQGTRFPWGDDLAGPDGRARLNRWEGASHARNDRGDGYVYVSPVRAFAPNAWGFHDPAGNVWQWTADVYAAGDDAGAPSERVLRGGSWWCAACTCEGYGLWYRGHAEARAAFSNNGFRCAYDAAE
ncbi:MAG: SUMF1/EgtB/PvdO family nonheme iron enzyme, partial [Deltaproteobacteria bacterium]|nr:SUMF1/EgtB/PvdO family nonheme iron enzyme [Deltaproteobacteria bacterium]